MVERIAAPALSSLRMLLAAAAACLMAGAAYAQEQPLDRREASALWGVLARAGDHGLAVPDLPQILIGLGSRSGAERTAAQAALQERAIEYAAAQHGGRLDPDLLPEEWAIRPARYDAAAAFADARAHARLREWAAALPPPSKEYQSLLRQRASYVGISAEGGWTPLMVGRTLRQGDRDELTLALRARLAIEGYHATPEESPELFDAPLSAALALYQEDRGLKADGVLGEATAAALNEPMASILRRIDLNLERLRWLPRELPATRVVVNVPAAELVYFEDGAEALRMRTIVGARSSRTPMLVTSIEAVILNPPWIVPDSIARNEILPAAAADPGYLERNGYTLTDGRLRQSPGPGNALGRIKLDSPNAFGVYMHDTPARALFAQSARALSHGCVRLELPRDLAAALLRDKGTTMEGIDAAIEGRATERIPLSAPVAAFFTYQTAVAEGGRLRLFPDLYGWDTQLDRLLLGAQTAEIAALSAQSLCSTQ